MPKGKTPFKNSSKLDRTPPLAPRLDENPTLIESINITGLTRAGTSYTKSNLTNTSQSQSTASNSNQTLTPPSPTDTTTTSNTILTTMSTKTPKYDHIPTYMGLDTDNPYLFINEVEATFRVAGVDATTPVNMYDHLPIVLSSYPKQWFKVL